MNKLLAKLPAFALPFVTRSLRGGRGRRYALMSLLIATATAMLGFWLALGSGSFEQSVRMEIGLEGNEWDRQRTEFVIFAHDDRELMRYHADAREIRRNPYADLNDNWGEVAMLTRDGRYLLEDFARAVNARTDEELALQARARAVLDPNGTIRDWSGYGRVSWNDPELRAQLERVLELEGVPEVKHYTSPLGLGDALTFVGFVAGLVLAACATVFAPLLVALQQAQERHENTLTPLTGTGLRSRELAIGLASGPVAVVAIFAAPQLLMFGGCALLVGNGLVALGLLAALAASGLFLIFAGQLLGHLIGHRRTPGIIAIAMMSVLGIAWLAGVALLSELERDTAGFAAVLPTLGLSGLLAQTFMDWDVAYFDILQLATVAWSVAALVFASLALAALSHEIEGRPGARLGRGATLLGALTCIGLMQLMIPFHVTEEGLRMYLGLGVLALPFAVLLMARVPVGDDPPRMRRVPVARLLGEFAGWCVAHIVVSTVLSGFDVGDTLHPVALIWMSWCVLVLGLAAIRVVSLQSSILSHLFLGVCGASLIMGFVQSAFWAFDSNHGLEDLFAMSQVSAVLGLLQIAVTVGIPLALVRSLRKNLGSLSAR